MIVRPADPAVAEAGTSSRSCCIPEYQASLDLIETPILLPSLLTLHPLIASTDPGIIYKIN